MGEVTFWALEGIANSTAGGGDRGQPLGAILEQSPVSDSVSGKFLESQ